MRIVFAPADLEGSGWYRMLAPGLALRARGHDVSFALDSRDRRIAQADVLVLQGRVTARAFELLEQCRARGVRTVYELDDNFHALPSAHPLATVYGSGRSATRDRERMIRESGLLIVSTAALAREYGDLNANVLVAENALCDEDVATYAPARLTGEPNRTGELRIGWAGSPTHAGDMRSIASALERVLIERTEGPGPRVRLVFGGADMRAMFVPGVRSSIEYAGHTFGFRAGSLEPFPPREEFPAIQYYAMLALMDLDVAIAPLERNTFNRCKSALKLMEYGMLGVPAVATRFGPYQDYGERADGPVAMYATTAAQWYEALVALLESASARRTLAEKNLAYVRREHVLSRHVADWEEAFRSLLPSARV